MDLLLVFRAAVVVFTIASLAGVGLELTAPEAAAALRRPRFVTVTLVASWVLSPALALLLVYLLPIARPYATALLMLALAPCAPFAPAVVRAAGGDRSSLAAFVLLSAVATAVVMPIGVPLLVGGPSVEAWLIARPLVMFVVIPLIGGMLLRGAQPSVARRATRPVALLSAAAGAVVLILIPVLYGRGVIEAIGSAAILAQVLFVVGVTAVAELAGTGLSRADRTVVTLGVCTRNLGAALAPLPAIEPDPRAVVMIAIGAVVTLAVSAVVARRLAPPITPPGAPAAATAGL